MPEMLLSCVPHVWRILQGVLNVVSSLRFAQSAAAAQEIAEAPPAADEARRFRGSVPIGGHEVDGDRLTRRYSEKTMQNFVHVLPTPLACRPEKKSRNRAASCASFEYFLCEQKVPLRRHGHADSTANPAPKPTPLCRF